MKKLLLALFLVSSTPIAILAQDTVPPPLPFQDDLSPLENPSGTDQYFYLGFAGTTNLAAQSQGSVYSLGGGGEMVLGYSLDSTLAFQFQLDNLIFHGANDAGLYSLRPLLEIKLSLDLDDFEPFIFAGPGLNLQFVSVDDIYNMRADFDAVIGLGAQCLIADDLMLYAEGKYNTTYVGSGTLNGAITQDVPLELGLLFIL